jgi:hypothetical protein
MVVEGIIFFGRGRERGVRGEIYRLYAVLIGLIIMVWDELNS